MTVNMRALEGTIIADGYRLDQYLNEGRFGAVYRATQIVYGVELRQVAVKLAKQPMTDSQAREVFGDALMMARLAENAPDAALREHFVAIYDAGRCPENGSLAGHPFMVMEFVNLNLRDCLRAGAFPLTRVIEYFDQILQAVAFMHGGLVGSGEQHKAIIHRDLKPENILVARRRDVPDVVKITDFGLAIETDSLLRWVETGGDLAYMAPESFTHNISSTQSDVYTLGLLFYEMLTGSNPFGEVGAHLRGTHEEKEQALRRLHLTTRQTEKFRLLEQHEELIHRPAMAQVIRNALAADMGSRTFADACELRAAWERAKGIDMVCRSVASAWDTVKRLTNEAEQCFRVGNEERGQDLLRQAMEINRDKTRVSDPMAVGRTYLLMVEQLLRQGKSDDAGRLAAEGYHRRRCRSTCLCMARFFASVPSPLTARFEQEAESCSDQE